MKQAQRKSFDWYKMQQRFSIRKYHFGAASVLLGTALVLGAGARPKQYKQMNIMQKLLTVFLLIR